MREPPRALTLDLFGTLVDFSVPRDEPPLVADLLDEIGAGSDPQAVLETWMRASLADRAKTPFRTVRSTLEHGARVAADRHGIAIEPERWASSLEALWASRPLHDDVEETLDLLDDAGVPRAIVTNLDRGVLARVLERTPLGGRVDAAICSEHARAYKPHPRPFRMALDELRVEPDAAIHVGDRPGEDRAGARATGMACVIVDRPGTDLVEALARAGLR